MEGPGTDSAEATDAGTAASTDGAGEGPARIPFPDLFLSPALRADPHEARRGRAVLAVALLGVTTELALYGHRFATSGHRGSSELVTALLGTSGLFLSAPLLLRVTGSHQAGGAAVVAAAVIMAAVDTWDAHGLSRSVVSFLPVIPVAAVLLVSRSFAVPITLVCVLIAWAAAIASGLSDSETLAMVTGPILGTIIASIFRGVEEATRADAIASANQLRAQAEELEASRDRAEAADRAKGEFLANMSHEIRTPLNGVLGMTTLLLDGPLTAQQRDYADTIRASSEALLTVINDILDFSKVEAGQLVLESVSFDIEPLVEQVAQLFAQHAGTKGLELVTDLHPGLPTAVIGDPGRIRQILVNLVGNAVKFTEEGEVVLRVTVDEEHDDDVVLGFEVQDTGAGIPKEAQAHLFDQFFQADASTTRRYGGTGLGLAICSRLVELMGGQIGVDSEVGLGSTFWFTLPLRRADILTDDALPPLRARGVRVLVVDDNDTQRAVVEERLRSWGVEVTGARDATEALEHLGQMSRTSGPPRLALLDLHMPGMNGLELARHIRNQHDPNDVEIALLTGVGFPIDPQSLRSAGVQHALTKPIRWSRLHEVVSGLARADRKVHEPEPEAPPPVHVRREGRILVVEDNAINQKVARHMLDLLGYDADIVSDGVQAVEAWRRTRYATILMDLHMPVMNGLDATREIRRLEAEAGTSTPIIAMTADAMPEDRERCLEAGMNAHLPKPMQKESLEPLLRYWVAVGLGRASRSDEPPVI